MKLDEIKEQRSMTTEIKKLNRIIKLQYAIVGILFVVAIFQAVLFVNFQNLNLFSITKSDIKGIDDNITNVEKAVHYRYFNLTNSLKDIHRVNIETHNGHVIK